MRTSRFVVAFLLLAFAGGCAGLHPEPMYNNSREKKQEDRREVSDNPEMLLWQNLFSDQPAETQPEKKEKKGKKDQKGEESLWRKLQEDLFGPSNNAGDDDK